MVKRKYLTLLCVLVVSVGAVACEKLEPEPATEPPIQRGDLLLELVPSTDSIPLEYGELEAVIPHAKNEQWAGLWFVDEEETISVVYVNVVEGRIYKDVLRIPRQ